MPIPFNTLLEIFAEAITEKSTTLGKFNPEDQLNTPIDEFFRAIGRFLGLTAVWRSPPNSQANPDM